MSILAISISFSYIICSLLIVLRFKTIFSPILLTFIFFSFQVIFALIFFGKYNLYLNGILWIFIALLFYVIGGLFVKTRSFHKVRSITMSKSAIKFTKFYILLFSILGFIYVFIFFKSVGITFTDLFDLQELLSINRRIADSRYLEEQERTIIESVTLVFVYLAPLLSGFYYNFSTKNKLITILSFLPALVIIMTQNTKVILIGSTFMFVTGFIVSGIITTRIYKIFVFKNIIKFVVFLFAFFALLYISMVFRTGSINSNTIEYINERFVLYSFGHIIGFDIWFSESSNIFPSYLGTRIFYGIADFIGISNRLQGVYQESVSWGSFSTNVYSVFRALIEDFGTIISLGILFFYGMFSQHIFMKVKHRLNYVSIWMLSVIYFTTFFGVFTSPWAYMSFTLVFVIFGFYLSFLYFSKGLLVSN